MFPKFQLLFDDSDVLGGPAGTSDSKSDLDILNEGDDAPEETGAVAEEEGAAKPEEPGEEEKPEEKAKTPEPETDDTEVPEGQLRFKDVKSKYPAIFKDFPKLA